MSGFYSLLVCTVGWFTELALHLAFYGNRSRHRCSLHSTRFRRFSASSRHVPLFGGAKIGASGTLIEGAGRGRGGEKRRRLPANR